MCIRDRNPPAYQLSVVGEYADRHYKGRRSHTAHKPVSYTHLDVYKRQITHVPLIISLPGTFRQNAVYDGLVEQTDLAPTIADLCGIPPADTHGRSLVPVLTGQNAPAPRKRACARPGI